MKEYPHIKLFGFKIAFDTFQDSEGYDRLIKNGIRIIGIISTVFLVRSDWPGLWMLLQIPLIFMALLLCGITKLEYLVKKKGELIGLEFWR